MSFELLAPKAHHLAMPGSTLSPTLSPHPDAVVIRPAYPDDAMALERLAALDSSRPLRGPILIAERDGRPMAALDMHNGRAVADPFAPTADLVALLRVHAADPARSAGRREILRRLGANPWRRPAFARG
jgi:hypothetical protein